MADYYSILRKTIDGLPKNAPDIRQAVYKKARLAIENQLRGMSPPLGEEAIESQLKLLEESILVVDSEYAEPDIGDLSAGLDDGLTAGAALEPSVSEPETISEIPPVPASATTSTESLVTPDVSQTSEPAPVAAEVAAVSTDNGEAFAEDAKESGGSGKIIALLVALGLIGGGAYAAWSQKDQLSSFFGSMTGGETEQSSSENAALENQNDALINEDTAAQTDKEPEQLDPTENTDEPEVVEEAPEDTPVIENEDEASASEENSTDQPVEEIVEDSQSDNSASEDPSVQLGEVAYLYEEGSAGSGATRTNASIAWSLGATSLSAGLPEEAVIVGTMEVPEKSLSLEIEIKRNIDEALSASHIIELRFEVPEGFTGSGIDNIARFVMKATEEARGEPLVAVPVKVSDGYFLIALDNLQQAVDVNTQLMLDSGWIDIPVSYATGKRALVTLEKGGSGDRVFQDAFKDWQNR